MAHLAFSEPIAAAERRRLLRRAPLVFAGALWVALLALLFGIWLAAPEQRGLALSACETLGRAGLRCPKNFVAPASDCAMRGRGGACLRAP